MGYRDANSVGMFDFCSVTIQNIETLIIYFKKIQELCTMFCKKYYIYKKKKIK